MQLHATTANPQQDRRQHVVGGRDSLDLVTKNKTAPLSELRRPTTHTYKLCIVNSATIALVIKLGEV